MCILRLSSKSTSLKSILADTNLSLMSVYDAGEYRNIKKTRLCDSNQATLSVSDKDWNDVEAQIEDAISFLESNQTDIKNLFELIDDLSACLDFPITSKLDGNIVTHGITYPSELTKLAGPLNIGIGMTLYENGLFE